jgi:hypothetical protein
MKKPRLVTGVFKFGAALHPKKLTELYPASFVPVTAAFMLAPAELLVFALFPLPIVGMDDEPMLWANPSMFLYVPAIASPIANGLR